MNTPSYIYDINCIKNQIKKVRDSLVGIPLTYSVKANAFVLNEIADDVDHIEVCSPGELSICKTLSINPKKIIYSGVMKERVDIDEAISYGCGILTAESKFQFLMISDVATEKNKTVKVILRLSSNNQFGMDPSDIYSILDDVDNHNNVELYGFHYYSGTQKKKITQIEEDLLNIETLITYCNQKYNYKPCLVEYGPGLAIEYFKSDSNDIDDELLKNVAHSLCGFSKKHPLGVELGRYLASSCGTYITTVKDIKTNYDINYAILDGGIHHIKYYGQIMAMHSPKIVQKKKDGEKKKYSLCGSLCTVADVLVKDIELSELNIGDILEFHKCGAYSITEASTMFLSRDMPCVYLRKDDECVLIRGPVSSSKINTEGFGL